MAFSSATLFSVDDVFSHHDFVIPEFQRGYAWSRDQWKALWDDVTGIASRDRGMHYGGSIMVSAQVDETKSVELIDGQQRMTSISLMLAALGDKGFPIEFRSNEPMQVYFDYFARGQSHLAPRLGMNSSYYARNIENAHRFFHDQASVLTSDDKADLANALRTKFKIFVLIIQPDFNVHLAFESINNRGRPLSTLEKLKNRLIYLASNADNAVDGAEVVAEVHSCWKQIYAWLGAGKALLDDDDFLRAHSMGWFKHDRKADWLATQLFESAFSTQATMTLGAIRSYVHSLEVAAACWYYINSPDGMHPTVAKRLKALKGVPTSSTKPLLLWALLRLADSDQRLVRDASTSGPWIAPFEELVRQAERFGTLVTLASGRQANAGRSDVAKSTYALAHADTPLYPVYHPNLRSPADSIPAVGFAAAHLKSLIYNLADDDHRNQGSYLDPRFPWEGYFRPDAFKTEVARLFVDRSGYYNWHLGKLIIHSWEDFLRGESGRPEKLPWDRFSWDDSVEHIFPQTADKSTWGKSIPLRTNANKGARSGIINSLGNLLLLSRSRNSTVSNESFERTGQMLGKRERFRSGSYSEIQVASLCDRWTVVQIAARGIAMLRHAQHVWDFEVVSDGAKLTDWLPYLFGSASESVRMGAFTHDTKITHKTLEPWVQKFERPLP
jgi:hypothetical protein